VLPAKFIEYYNDRLHQSVDLLGCHPTNLLTASVTLQHVSRRYRIGLFCKRGKEVGDTMNSLNDPFETNDTLRRISRFLAVGMLGTLTDMLLFAILHTGLGVPTLVPNTLSYCAGIVNNFLLRRHWTFAQLTHQALDAGFTIRDGEFGCVDDQQSACAVARALFRELARTPGLWGACRQGLCDRRKRELEFSRQ
jgi:hypothetical protein